MASVLGSDFSEERSNFTGRISLYALPFPVAGGKFLQHITLLNLHDNFLFLNLSLP